MDPFVKAVQEKLKAAGYDPGLSDGLAGPRTRAAIAAFQKDMGLPVTETVTEKTWTLLDTEAMPERDRDPPVAEPEQLAPVWPRQKDCMTFYGPVGQHQKRLELPYNMHLAWNMMTVVKVISVHEKVHASAGRVFERIASTFDEDKRRSLGIDIFGGSLNVRKMRGGNNWSMHAWGIAIDFDPIRNQLKWGKDRARLAEDDAIPFWELWEDEGWVSLGRTRNYDWMHIQAARL